MCKAQLIVFFIYSVPSSLSPSASRDKTSHTHRQEEILFPCLLSFPHLRLNPHLLHRCPAGDADAGGEEDLSVPADGGHAVGHPVLPDPTVQTPLRAHQERQVSAPYKSEQQQCYLKQIK